MNVLGANFQNTVEIVNKRTYVVIINYERGCLFPVVPSILMELIMPHILCESEIVNVPKSSSNRFLLCTSIVTRTREYIYYLYKK